MQFAHGRFARVLALVALPCGFLVIGPGSIEALAQAKLEARYRVTLAGLPIGGGGWTIEVTGNRYAMEASGQTSGLVNMFTGGTANASARGAVNGGRLIPSTFNLSVTSRRNVDAIQFALAGGNIKSLSVDPPPKPAEDREPLTEAHKKGVLDPISAGLLPVSGPVGPDVCRRTLPVFDGRQRFDLAFSFKRMEMVKSEQGYAGPAVVCAVKYTPLGGFYHGRSSTKFLRESPDIEVWYAPIVGTEFVATYRIHIPTTIGPAVLYATQFEAVGSNRAEKPAGRVR